ncbi:hypothetical protein K435DRAFT_239049 [Dendrothele bispora CBS 962.96]|uniref:Uncharacterized protein n=1 Tax=Dendrothele bispora (strain CBS 962.96) TaxID=1314807 RepID=A0A4S8MME2_DENBC|nr:hypothetical protein K435DRAFT_239049 [Dendrothele bispora CBS 962.96]
MDFGLQIGNSGFPSLLTLGLSTPHKVALLFFGIWQKFSLCLPAIDCVVRLILSTHFLRLGPFDFQWIQVAVIQKLYHTSTSSSPSMFLTLSPPLYFSLPCIILRLLGLQRTTLKPVGFLLRTIYPLSTLRPESTHHSLLRSSFIFPFMQLPCIIFIISIITFSVIALLHRLLSFKQSICINSSVQHLFSLAILSDISYYT